MKTKTKAAKILFEAGWSWEEVRVVLESEDKITSSFDRRRNIYSLTDYGTYVNNYGEVYSIPVYDVAKSGKNYITNI